MIGQEACNHVKNVNMNYFLLHIRSIPSFEVFIFFVGERSVFGLFPFVCQLLNLIGVHFNFLWAQGQSFDQVKVRIANQGSQDPKEGLFILVV